MCRLFGLLQHAQGRSDIINHIDIFIQICREADYCVNRTVDIRGITLHDDWDCGKFLAIYRENNEENERFPPLSDCHFICKHVTDRKTRRRLRQRRIKEFKKAHSNQCSKVILWDTNHGKQGVVKIKKIQKIKNGECFFCVLVYKEQGKLQLVQFQGGLARFLAH